MFRALEMSTHLENAWRSESPFSYLNLKLRVVFEGGLLDARGHVVAAPGEGHSLSKSFSTLQCVHIFFTHSAFCFSVAMYKEIYNTELCLERTASQRNSLELCEDAVFRFNAVPFLGDGVFAVSVVVEPVTVVVPEVGVVGDLAPRTCGGKFTLNFK